MDAILGWIKSIVYFSVFLTVLLQLLPNEKYKKYIRFFAGLLMMLLVLKPVFSLFDTDVSKDVFSDEFYQEQSEEIELDMKELEEGGYHYYEQMFQTEN